MTPTATLAQRADVVAFWFARRPAAVVRGHARLRCGVTGALLTTYRAAAAGQLTDWETTAEGALALVIVLDQFPLNLFWGQPRASPPRPPPARSRIAPSPAASIRRAADQRQFLYLPFMHSEALADQDRSVRLYQQPGLEEGLRFARHHHDLIERFGRFPHRNAILGRISTAEELAYLASPEAFHG